MPIPSTHVVHCPQCGTNNRVSDARIASGVAAVCGRCKSTLPGDAAATDIKAAGTASEAPVGVLTVTDATFATAVERWPTPVLLDLWAPWCGPCRALAPVLDGLAREWGGRVRVAKLNVDENPDIAGRFRVSSIPLMVVLVGGREVDRIVGVQPGGAIRQRVERAAGV